jgi:hypothetical protein
MGGFHLRFILIVILLLAEGKILVWKIKKTWFTNRTNRISFMTLVFWVITPEKLNNILVEVIQFSVQSELICLLSIKPKDQLEWSRNCVYIYISNTSKETRFSDELQASKGKTYNKFIKYLMVIKKKAKEIIWTIKTE